MARFNLIDPSVSTQIKPLLGAFPHHTVLATILSGITPGNIYVDDLRTPRLVIANYKGRTFISAEPSIKPGQQLGDWFINCLIPGSQKTGNYFAMVFARPSDWLDALGEQLVAFNPKPADYRCYGFNISENRLGIPLPDGFTIRPVSRMLLKENFGNKALLLEEMCSERDSISSFLDHSFGVCAFHGDELAGWCLSEYNHTDCCEVGIATLSPFQQQGLARAMTQSFLSLAFSQGISTVLWHCFSNNQPSWRTALSAGFRLLEEQTILLLDLRPGGNRVLQP